MKKVLFLFLLLGSFILSAEGGGCRVNASKETCDLFGKPQCHWESWGCVPGMGPDAKQSTIEKHPLEIDLGSEKSKDLPPPKDIDLTKGDLPNPDE